MSANPRRFVYEDNKHPSGPPPTAEPTGRPGQPVDAYRLFRVLRQSAVTLLAVAAFGAVLGYVVPKFLMPRSWESKAILVYEGVLSRDSDGNEERVADPRDLRTMVDSVKLPKSLRKVQEAVGHTGQLDIFAKKIDVTFELESNLVIIAGKGDSGPAATELTNTMVDVFLEHRKSVDRERLRKAVDEIERSLKAAKTRAIETRAAYDAFRKEKGITDLTAEREQGIESAADLRAKADLAAARARELNARIATLERDRKDRPVKETPPEAKVSAADRKALEDAKVELEAAMARYTEEHPRVQTLKAKVRSLASRIAAGGSGGGSGVSLGRLKRERDAALDRQRAFEAQADEAQGKISKFSAVEGQASTLLAAVEVASARVRELQERLGEAEISVRTASSGFRVESPAAVPDAPTKDKKRYIVAFAIPAVMLLLVLGFFLWRELGTLRVCTPSEVAYWGKGPVIGSTTWPRETAALNDLIAEMDDHMVDASGSTLVVPATERELDLVKAISERFSEEDWSPDQVFVTSVEVLPPPVVVTEAGSQPPPSNATAMVQSSRPGALANADDNQFALKAEAWTGPEAGPALRRASRRADRVLVIVRAEETTAVEVSQVPGRVGRNGGIGYLVVGLDQEYTKLPDRVGPVSDFWRTFRG